MIRSFRSKCAQDIFDGDNSRYARKLPSHLQGKAYRLMDQLNVVREVQELKVPPGNRLEKLKGDLKDFWSIRINDQWRLIFVWKGMHAFEVDIVDYH